MLPISERTPLTRRAGAVLIDNSTYFAVMRALEGLPLTPEIVYNLAVFLEALVLADEVYLSPTTGWHPTADDPLFAAAGPCRAVQFSDYTEDQLRSIFATAVRQSLDDVNDLAVRSAVPLYADPLETGSVVGAWATSVRDDPMAFARTYSVAVFITDPASLSVVSRLPDVGDPGMPAAERVAHYLLRTNVALELSREFTYYPHSHRVAFVAHKLGLYQQPAVVLLHEAERGIRENLANLVQLSNGVSLFEDDVPLILAVVLSNSKVPSDIVHEALRIRSTDAATNYRLWSRKLVEKMAGDLESVRLAVGQLTAAKQELIQGLQGMYGARPSSLPGRVSRLVSADQVVDVATFNAVGLARSVLSRVGIMNLVDAQLTKRNLAFLMGLARRRREIDSLNSLLESVFHQKLEGDGIRGLRRLRVEQEALMDGRRA
jgi:hypothetical protein